MTLRRSIFLPFLISSLLSVAQEPDTVRTIELKEVEIKSTRDRQDIQRLPAIQGTFINAGKKNEVVVLTEMDADVATNNVRQVLGKVPGVTIWESDGSGIQTGIATRGLSPNRSWEFNVRQNGYDISAEPFGYPEAYYSPALEAVERIEFIRGAASLQFGPQFGGSLNYIMKRGSKDKPFCFETRQTFGSYGLFSSYNALGGTNGKFDHYIYLHHRSADGWRENSRYDLTSVYGSIGYAITPRSRIGLEYTRMDYESQQPGGLTDAMFATDPRNSVRSRNWFSAPWNVGALTYDHAFSEDLKLNVKVFTTIAERNSIGFLKPIDVEDVFDPETGAFASRQLDRDAYTNIGAEIRMLKGYTLFGNKDHISFGVRTYKGSIDRRQRGVGSTGSDLDISTSAPFEKEFQFGTTDHAIFVENQFKFGERLSVIPGVRYEIINSTASGRINATGSGELADKEQQRQFALYGVGAEYAITRTCAFYGNFSQAYRPVLFSNLVPAATTDRIDPDLKDATGHNIDLGYRGSVKDHLQFDVSAFMLSYDNRIGTINKDGSAYQTNIGASESKGIEAFVEWDPIAMLTRVSKVGHLKLFVSYANIDARYTRWDDPARMDDAARTYVGKRVEYSPETIARYGATWNYRSFSITFQANDVGAIFTDAANTVTPNSTGTTGRLDGYRVMDISATLKAGRSIELRAGVNNIGDVMYATRRSGGYPGPGILPANPRTGWFSVGAKF